MPKEEKKVIIWGSTGAVGQSLCEVLAKKQPDWKIFAVSRSSSSSKSTSGAATSSSNDKFAQYPNVTVIKGDPNIKSDVMKLSADKDIIYSCIGFSRFETKFWAANWPTVVDNLLEASKQKEGQKLVFCDNLYAYGPTTNVSPDTPRIASSKKSKLGVRAIIHEKFQQRMSENSNSLTVVGSSEFFGPNLTKTSFLGDTFTKPIVEGKQSPMIFGSSSVVHDFCYSPDLSNALYIAGIDDRANGKFWICPHAIQNKTLKQIAKDIDSLKTSEKSNAKVTVLPNWSIKMLSPFMSFMKEMVEMLPFWTMDYTVDDSEFCKTFGVKATPYEEALKEYIQFYEKLNI